MIRMEQCRKSQPYQEAKRLNREKDKAKGNKLFQEARKQARYSDYNEIDFSDEGEFYVTHVNEKLVAAGVVEAMIFPWEMT